MRTRDADVPAEPSVEQTRRRLLQAARELYTRKGSRGTTTREVAERAGVNETTLFRHFGTKQALLDAMREHFCPISELRETLAKSDESLEAALRRIGAQIHEQMLRDQDLICMALAEALLDPDSDVSLRIPRHKRALVTEFLERRVAAGELRGEPRAIASVFLGAIFADVLGRRVWPDDQVPVERFIEFLVGSLLHGVQQS